MLMKLSPARESLVCVRILSSGRSPVFTLFCDAFGVILKVAATYLTGGMSICFPARRSATVRSCIFGYFLFHIFDS